MLPQARPQDVHREGPAAERKPRPVPRSRPLIAPGHEKSVHGFNRRRDEPRDGLGPRKYCKYSSRSACDRSSVACRFLTAATDSTLALLWLRVLIALMRTLVSRTTRSGPGVGSDAGISNDSNLSQGELYRVLLRQVSILPRLIEDLPGLIPLEQLPRHEIGNEVLC